MKRAKLILADGKTYEGFSFGYAGSKAGEVVFNTAMTGYPESLTDPSYQGQILVATYPLIGNYGVPLSAVDHDMHRYYESDKLHLSGFVVSDYSEDFSHWNAEKSLHRWMQENRVPGIFGIDTRDLTRHIRNHGVMLGKIVVDDVDPGFTDPNSDNLVAQVSIKSKKVYGEGRHTVMLVDCGLKNNIIRHLLQRDTKVVRVPWDYDYTDDDYDALFISNGPGDPKMCKPAIDHLAKAMQQDKPVFGICLGSQLMGLATGADTYKLDYGHRGHNQPVQHTLNKKAYITSQNHGYAVAEDSLAPEWKPLFINLNDDTLEGIYHVDKPFFATQFHPEASGGPTDTEFLFDVFVKSIEESKKI